MKTWIKTILALAAIAALWSCQASDGGTNAAEESVPVEIMTVKRGDIVQSLSYTGDICAEFEVNVFSKIADRIETFYVDEGDYVQKGQPLARILAGTIEQGVKQAEAALLAARVQQSNLKLEFERAERLYGEDALSKQQYDAVKTQYEASAAQTEQAEAAFKSAGSLFKDALITAPISGIIGKRYFENGDMATPSAPLLRIVQMERVRIEFNATEEDLGKLAIGQRADVKVKAYPDTVFAGKVVKISPILDPLTRMAEVEVLVPNRAGMLKPGMFANVEVTTSILHDVLVVPRHATLESTTMERVNGKEKVVRNYYVFKVDSNYSRRAKLDVSYVNHISMAVNGGIKAGDRIVVAGQNNLRDSTLVAVIAAEGGRQ